MDDRIALRVVVFLIACLIAGQIAGVTGCGFKCSVSQK